MFASLSGNVTYINVDYCVIDVAGVGYLVFCPLNVLQSLTQGSATTLHIQTIVKEDSITLYGFNNVPVKHLFNMLITVQGVGPRIAMAALSKFSYNQLVQSIMLQDISLLKQISGVGLKVAQRIVNELYDKINKMAESQNIKTTQQGGNVADATHALLGLGYTQAQINTALTFMPSNIETLSAEEIIKSMLKHFASAL